MWYYTDWDGLRDILEKNELCVTHAEDLNDSGELSQARQVLRKMLAERGWSDAEVSGALHPLADAEQDDQAVASFYAEGDLLSQWREHARRGQPAFAVGFDKSALSQWARDLPASLLKCVYRDDEHRQVLEKLPLEPMRKALKSAGETMSLNTAAKDLRWSFLKEAIRIRSEAQKSEQEWRLVYDGRQEAQVSDEPSSWQVRAEGPRQVRYLALPLEGANTPLITQVRIGPASLAPDTEATIRKFLASLAPRPWIKSPLAVDVSQIPAQPAPADLRRGASRG